LTALGEPQPSIVVFDPACGSGEFLRESLRQLQIRGYPGHIKLMGWDISEAACDMANFVLAWEIRDTQANATVEISRLNSLSIDWPEHVDIVLMNPPFVAWENLNAQQREEVADVLGELSRPRPDLSHAFLWKAASCLRDQGSLGSILPASFLDGQSAQRLRGRLREQMSPRLIARLGSHLLFPSAMIDAAFYVATKKTNPQEPAVAFWADHRLSSNAAGLRTLRKIRQLQGPHSYPVVKEGFSIYLNSELGRSDDSWAPRPYNSWVLLQKLNHLPRVKDLFDVKQGVRTGHNPTFLLNKNEWLDLPKDERRYFRPAVVNKSIQKGSLQDLVYVFYPYSGYEIKSEEMLRNSLHNYYHKHLLPNKKNLQARARVNVERWWELTLHRAWQVDHDPKLVSTYFGDVGSFAWDQTGDFVVVQGFCWLPKQPRAAELFPRKLGFAYLAILNSSLFSQLLSAVSNHVGGGQWNLSKRFVDKIPIPDLTDEAINPALISQLSKIGERFHSGLAVDDDQVEELVYSLFGVDQTS